MRNLTCIVCPIGCSLEVEESSDFQSTDFQSTDFQSDDSLSVTGNKCPRGVVYAQEEIRAPKRVVTATCRIKGEGSYDIRRIPVKTTSPCPREKIPSLLDDIYKTKVPLPVKTGDIVIANWNGEGIDIVATRTLGG